MTKRWISFWTVLLALALGGQSHAAQPGQALGPDVDGLPFWVTLDGYKVMPTQFMARLNNPKDMEQLGARLAKLDLVVLRSYGIVPGLVNLGYSAKRLAKAREMVPGQLAGALQAKLGQVRDTGLFRYVEPDFYRSINRVTNDAAFTDGTLWGLNNQGQNGGTDGADIDAPEAWDITVGSRNIIVAVVDTGVRYTHQDLVNQMWVNEDEVPNNGLDDDLDGFVDNIYGADIIGNDGDPMDWNGHGSHVAGTIGAEAGNGHPHVGVAWDVQLMAIQVFGASGQGSMAAVTGAIDFATQNGAHVINLSLGGYGFNQSNYDALSAAGDAGIIVSAGTGNDAIDNDAMPFFPASYDLECIIAVAGTDRNDNLASFSNYGKTTAHLAGPAVTIYSSVASADDAYDVYDGTSMATPHVSGVAALLFANDNTLSASQLKAQLLNTSVLLDDLRDRLTFQRWVAYSYHVPDLPIDEVMSFMGAGETVQAAYVAPFPEQKYKAGAQIMPYLVPSQLRENEAAWAVFEAWDKPFLVAFTDSDPVTAGGERMFLQRVPTAQNVTIKGARHFVQEDAPEAVAALISQFVQLT